MRVLVTGANGHVGFNLVRKLAGDGHDVTATVRSLDDAGKTAELAQIAGVRLAGLDIRNGQAFRRLADGMDVIHHVAATYTNVVKTEEEARSMIADSVEGATSAILAAAGGNVGRVVLTSSVVTLPVGRVGDPPVTEADWRTTFVIPYEEAKTRAEQEAWALADRHGVALATILPGMVFGPGFRRSTPSTDIIASVVGGAFRMGIPDMLMPPPVDVRDVAAAHALAAERGATGRFIVCIEGRTALADVVAAVKAAEPKAPVLSIVLPKFADPVVPAFDWLNHTVFGLPRTMTSAMHKTYNGNTHLNPSTARARGELGWVVSHKLAASVADTLPDLKRL